MKKPVCFLFDSSSSIKEGEFSDTFVLPLQVSEVTDNGEVNYKDGVNIFTKEIEKQLIENKSFKTSSSSAADILQKFEELSKLYEHIYVFLIPFTLSQGQTNVVSNIAEDFPNVTVIPHYMVALMARWEAKELVALKDSGKLTKEKVIKIVDKYKDHIAAGVIMPDLKHLIKGGRLGKTKGMIASLLGITALASFDKEGICFRSKTISDKKIPSLLENYYKLVLKDFDWSKVKKIGVIHSSVSDKKFDLEFYMDMFKKQIFPKANHSIKIEYSSLPAAIIVHIGPNYIAIAVYTD